MRPSIALSLALTGCQLSSEPHPVAVAHLLPLGSGIFGPLEVLGDISPIADDDLGSRTVAAYHVYLPDPAPRRVRIYDAASCDLGIEPTVVADLHQIQRVGDETHFFVLGVPVGDRDVAIDTGTIAADVTMDPTRDAYVIGKIAVVQALDDEQGLPGEWLACGVFVVPTPADP